MLFAEALSHTSYMGATASCSRMVYLVGLLLETFDAEMLLKRAEFQTRAMLLPECDKEKPVRTWLGGETYAVPWMPGEMKAWPPLPPWAPLDAEANKKKDAMYPEMISARGPRVTNAAQFKEWHGACCNNVTYAAACCSLELHKHILCTSADLQKAVRAFACFARHRTRDKTPLLPKLM